MNPHELQVRRRLALLEDQPAVAGELADMNARILELEGRVRLLEEADSSRHREIHAHRCFYCGSWGGFHVASCPAISKGELA